MKTICKPELSNAQHQTGQPLHEAIVQYGSFVMSNLQGVIQAIDVCHRDAFAA